MRRALELLELGLPPTGCSSAAIALETAQRVAGEMVEGEHIGAEGEQGEVSR